MMGGLRSLTVALDGWTAFQSVVALVTGIVYAYVARLVLSRHPSDEARVANYAFATWWACFGALEFLVAVYSLPSSLGYRDVAIVTTVLDLLFILIAAAFWGLVYYLAYLYTGSSKTLWPITLFYALLAVGLVYLIAWLDVSGFDAQGQIVCRQPPVPCSGLTPAGISILLGLALSLPIVGAAIAYGSLYFRATERTQRFRIAITAGSFVLWFGWSTLSSVLGLSRRAQDLQAAGDPSLQHTLSLVNSAIALVVPVFVVLAYRPPLWLRTRLGVEPVA